jgi:ankyrin repeat protein
MIIMKLKLTSFFLLALISSCIYADGLSDNERDKNSFFIAAKSNQIEDVISFLEKDKKYAKISTVNNQTALHLAANNGNLELVKLLIEKGADVNAKTNDDATPLHVAANNDNLELVKLLIENDADVNAKTNKGATPLHMAAVNGHFDIAKLLIENDAKVNEKTNDDATPLHVAANNGNLELVKLLIENDADINAKTNKGATPGATPLHMAAGNGHFDIAKLLIENDANVNAKTNKGATPLHWAAENGYFDVAKLLIENDADVNEKTNESATPLHWVAGNDHFDVAKLLIENDADLNAKTNKGATPLLLAAGNDHFDVAKLLIDNGADVNARTQDGLSPFQTAMQKGNIELMKLLQAKGADMSISGPREWLPSIQEVIIGAGVAIAGGLGWFFFKRPQQVRNHRWAQRALAERRGQEGRLLAAAVPLLGQNQMRPGDTSILEPQTLLAAKQLEKEAEETKKIQEEIQVAVDEIDQLGTRIHLNLTNLEELNELIKKINNSITEEDLSDALEKLEHCTTCYKSCSAELDDLNSRLKAIFEKVDKSNSNSVEFAENFKKLAEFANTLNKSRDLTKSFNKILKWVGRYIKFQKNNSNLQEEWNQLKRQIEDQANEDANQREILAKKMDELSSAQNSKHKRIKVGKKSKDSESSILEKGESEIKALRKILEDLSEIKIQANNLMKTDSSASVIKVNKKISPIANEAPEDISEESFPLLKINKENQVALDEIGTEQNNTKALIQKIESLIKIVTKEISEKELELEHLKTKERLAKEKAEKKRAQEEAARVREETHQQIADETYDNFIQGSFNIHLEENNEAALPLNDLVELFSNGDKIYEGIDNALILEKLLLRALKEVDLDKKDSMLDLLFFILKKASFKQEIRLSILNVFVKNLLNGVGIDYAESFNASTLISVLKSGLEDSQKLKVIGVLCKIIQHDFICFETTGILEAALNNKDDFIIKLIADSFKKSKLLTIKKKNLSDQLERALKSKNLRLIAISLFLGADESKMKEGLWSFVRSLQNAEKMIEFLKLLQQFGLGDLEAVDTEGNTLFEALKDNHIEDYLEIMAEFDHELKNDPAQKEGFWKFVLSQQSVVIREKLRRFFNQENKDATRRGFLLCAMEEGRADLFEEELRRFAHPFDSLCVRNKLGHSIFGTILECDFTKSRFDADHFDEFIKENIKFLTIFLNYCEKNLTPAEFMNLLCGYQKGNETVIWGLERSSAISFASLYENHEAVKILIEYVLKICDSLPTIKESNQEKISELKRVLDELSSENSRSLNTLANELNETMLELRSSIEAIENPQLKQATDIADPAPQD